MYCIIIYRLLFFFMFIPVYLNYSSYRGRLKKEKSCDFCHTFEWTLFEPRSIYECQIFVKMYSGPNYKSEHSNKAGFSIEKANYSLAYLFLFFTFIWIHFYMYFTFKQINFWAPVIMKKMTIPNCHLNMRKQATKCAFMNMFKPRVFKDSNRSFSAHCSGPTD